MLVPPTMQAMVMAQPRQPLVLMTLPLPVPSDDQVLVKIIACGLCHTDLSILDGQLSKPDLPDAAIIFAGNGELGPHALQATDRGVPLSAARST